MIWGEGSQTQGGIRNRRDQHAYDRLIVLSDAVFGFAITLAAIEIRAPEAWRGLAELWTALQVPVLTYFFSFAVVASYWVSQRSLFSDLVRVDAPLSLLTFLQLLFVTMIPVATGLYHEHSERPGALSAYCATLAACGYFNAAMWAYAALQPALRHAESSSGECWEKFSRAIAAPIILTCVALTDATLAVVMAVMLLLARRFILWRFGPHKPSEQESRS